MMARLRLYGGAILLLQGLSACNDERNVAPAPAEATNAPANAQTVPDGPLIVAFGDSLYAGYQLPQDEGLAPELQRVLRGDGIGATVVNAGVSGDTSAAGLARLAYVLDGQSRKPDLVIIGLGGNDLLRGIQPDQTRQNLAAMLTLLRDRDIPAMLTGMIAPRNLGPEYVSAFDALYPDLAREFGAALHPFLLDGVITNPALLLGDGIHPNEAGVDRMARAIAPTVAAALTSSDDAP